MKGIIGQYRKAEGELLEQTNGGLKVVEGGGGGVVGPVRVLNEGFTVAGKGETSHWDKPQHMPPPNP